MSSRPTSPLDLALPEGAGRRVLVTGASGYVGGRLVPELVAAGFSVRAGARDPRKLEDRPWADDVELVAADLEDADQVRAAMADVHTVLYLVHSMGSGGDFVEREAQIARTVAEAAESQGVEQIVYLGGLHPDKPLEELSDHMRSREQVGRILLESTVPTLVLRAGVVIGSGSASFEMIRHLTERLPVMPGPRWLDNLVEPIAIRDVLYYLAHASALTDPVNGTYDVGSGRPQPFKDLLSGYARVAGLRPRRIWALPIPAPRLSGFWIGMTTPIPRGLAMPLAASMAEDAVAGDHEIATVIPDPPGGLTQYPDACRLAIERQVSGRVTASWDDDVTASAGPADPLPSDPEWAGHTVYTDVREREGRAAPDSVWRVVQGIGGENGWYSPAVLWRLRGFLDKLVGGPGMARGRRHPHRLQVGDHVDFWRVESVEPGERLTLRAEMRSSGRAWLELSVDALPGGGSRYRQRAIFFPRGIIGRLYWLAVLPFHALIFPTMARNILHEAERHPVSGASPQR